EKDAKKTKLYDKKRKSEYNKRKKDLCDAFGVCTTCMKRDKHKVKLCIECYTKRKEKEKQKGVIPKSERMDKDICLMCNEPVVEGKYYCEKHLGILQKNIAKGREKKLSEMETKKTQEEQREKKNLYRRKKREICRAFGICTSCMKRKKHVGSLCLECYVKSKKRYDEKIVSKDKLPKHLWGSFELCTMCGKPRYGDSKLCKEHLEIARRNQKIASSYINRESHIWRNMNKADCVKAGCA
ncbi:hypothetical protein, partial [Romboutsia sp.]|uniref:hypothetical protein n=1 Tax=Romboutsia sp. TaxID=1965302 RepID=UPI002BDF751B